MLKQAFGVFWAVGLFVVAVPAPSIAQSSVIIGGTVDVAGRQVRNGSLGAVRSEVSGSNATSKLVIRATEDLGGGSSAGFYLDGTILADTGQSSTAAPSGNFWDRRSTVQLTNARFGEIRMGRDWVPTHLVWTVFDPFITLGIAGANSFRSFSASRALGQAFGTGGDSVQGNPTLRVNNAVEYFLPDNIGGFYGQVVKTLGENGTTAAGATRGDGFRLGWAGGGVNVGASQFITRNTAGGQRFKDQVIGASYDFKVAKINLAQRRWIYGPDRTVVTLLAGSIPVGLGQIKATYQRADQTGATAQQSANDASLFGLGYQYNLSKRTALYGHASRIDNKGAAVFTVAGGPAVSAVATAANYFGGRKSTAFEAGIRHDF